MMTRIKRIDLRDKKIYEARRAMKRLVKWRDEKKANVGFYFLMPYFEPKNKHYFYPERIFARCPYCCSPLVETEAGTVCSGKNLGDIGRDIQTTINRFGASAELYLSKKANRFFDYYILMGRDMTCDYVVGNEERRFRINNRILRPGVDRKMIKR